MSFNRKGNLTKYATITVVVVLVAAVTMWGFFVAVPAVIEGNPINWKWWELVSQIPGAQDLTQEEQTALAQTYPTTAKLSLKVSELIGGGTWSTTGNIKIYTVGDYSSPLETCDLDSNAEATSAEKYTTGDTYVIKIYNDALTEIMWTTFEVPGRSSEDETTIYAPVRMFTKPTYSIKLEDSSGNTYTDTGNWNITSGANPGYASGQLIVHVRNTADNTGFWESYDPEYDVDYKCCLQIKITGTNWDYTTLSGDYDFGTTIGSNRFYVVELPAESLKRVSYGDVVEGGSISLEFTITVQTSVADASDIDLDIYQFSSAEYFAAHGGNFGSFADQDADSDITVNIID